MMTEAYPIDTMHRVWRTLLTVRPEGGPLALRHAPHLALGDTGTIGVPVSAILYPSGLRASIRRALGLRREQVDLQAPGTDSDGAELARLRRDIAASSTVPLARLAEVFAALNCLTEQATIMRLSRGLSLDLVDDPAGNRVLYEVARAFARRQPAARQARSVLHALARAAVDPWVKVAASVQLGAAAIRTDRDLDAAAGHVSEARRVEHLLAGSDEFLVVQTQSRIARLTALLESKRRRFDAVAETMEEAHKAALRLSTLAVPRPAYDRLVAAENLKMVLEALLKSAGGRGDRTAVVMWAGELLALDHEDPGTWRDISTNAARCAMPTETALAAVGLAHVGGAGGVELCQAIDLRAPAAPTTELAERLRAAIADLNTRTSAEGRFAPATGQAIPDARRLAGAAT